MTIKDDLTELHNDRYLKKYLEIDVNRCLRLKKKVSLMFIDIDRFKRVNDTFGHLAGNSVLAEMGQSFKTMVRDADIMGRYGGDKFAIILPDALRAGALIIAECIRKKVEECEFIVHNNSVRLTVSLGVAIALSIHPRRANSFKRLAPQCIRQRNYSKTALKRQCRDYESKNIIRFFLQ